jgi:hypothetical protein
MMLGKVVGEVIGALASMDCVLPLFNLVFDPVETHVHGFGVSLFDCVINDAGRRHKLSRSGLEWDLVGGRALQE